MPSDSIFPDLTRPSGGAGAFGNETGYILGGYQTAFTTPQGANLDPEAQITLPGLVLYDTETGTWKNESNSSYTASGTVSSVQMQFVPAFGRDGMLIALGGATSDRIKFIDDGSNYLSFDEITFSTSPTGPGTNRALTEQFPIGISDSVQSVFLATMGLMRSPLWRPCGGSPWIFHCFNYRGFKAAQHCPRRGVRSILAGASYG